MIAICIPLSSKMISVVYKDNHPNLHYFAGSNYTVLYEKSLDGSWPPVRNLFERGSDGELVIPPNIMQNLSAIWRLLETKVEYLFESYIHSLDQCFTFLIYECSCVLPPELRCLGHLPYGDRHSFVCICSNFFQVVKGGLAMNLGLRNFTLTQIQELLNG